MLYTIFFTFCNSGLRDTGNMQEFRQSLKFDFSFHSNDYAIFNRVVALNVTSNCAGCNAQPRFVFTHSPFYDTY